MDRYVAFLRGMNLGGRRIKNDELRSRFEALGCAEVAAFRASGNVVFAADEEEGPLTARLEAGLEERLGYAVPVYLRTRDELRAIAAAEPFGAKAIAGSAGKLQIALLREAPTATARRQALALSNDADRLAVEGRELYWLRGDISESDLDLKVIAAALGPTTIRTKGTIDQIAARHFSR